MHQLRRGSELNKADLVAAVAQQCDLSRKDAESAVGAVLDEITRALAEEDKVQLVGFGTFAVKERAARMGTNPATKEPMEIKASKAVSFKAGKALKDAIK